MTETVFRNGRLVLPESVLAGDLVVRGEEIAEIGDGSGPPSRVRDSDIDLGGDWLLPGLVELHTDHLERHYAPRPGVRWNPEAAVQAHDAQIATSGITTVFDALRVGMDGDSAVSTADMKALGDAINLARNRDRLRADHFIHLRCEVSAPDVMAGFALFAGHERVRLASLMDHTPGQRQFASMEACRAYYQGKLRMSDAEFGDFVTRRQAEAGPIVEANRRAIADHCRARGIVVASHDDARAAHVAEAVEHGVSIAEFPTTIEAAGAARAAGLKILMGAPNVVRGGSHSGNIAATALAGQGLLDLLSSDYFPFSLLHAAFLLAAPGAGRIALPEAVAMVSRGPAEAAGLSDRGSLEAGRRADLVQVRCDGDVPVVRGVWRQGRRVA